MCQVQIVIVLLMKRFRNLKKHPNVNVKYVSGLQKEEYAEGGSRCFMSGEELIKLISEAQFSIYPSEWYENCPFFCYGKSDVWDTGCRSKNRRNS